MGKREIGGSDKLRRGEDKAIKQWREVGFQGETESGAVCWVGS